MNPTAQNIKLKRQLRELRISYVKVLQEAIEAADYKQWVAGVNAKIAQTNQAIRSSNK